MAKKSSVYIHPTADVARGVKIGAGTKVWHQAQVREGAVVGKNCVLGKSVYVDAGVKIGDRVKIQNFVSVYAGVTVEDDVLLGPACSFTNDLYPRASNADWKIVPTLVRRGASIGANATITCGVLIGEYAMIAAGAVVTNDVLPHALMIGSPARQKSFVCTCGSEMLPIDHQRSSAISRICKQCGTLLTVRVTAQRGRKDLVASASRSSRSLLV